MGDNSVLLMTPPPAARAPPHAARGEECLYEPARVSSGQIRRHNGQVAASASSPIAPVSAVACGAPIRSASQPSQTKPIGPVPMHTDSTPMMRERISMGAAR